MKIKDRVEFAQKPRPLTCGPETTVAEAVARMSKLNYGSIVVTDPEGRPKGLFTERDVMRRLVDKGLDAKTTKVSDVMSAEIRVAREEDDLRDWLRIMSNERFRRLPVVDAEGKLISIMTQGDFVSYTWPEIAKQAGTLARATYASNYQMFFIIGAILVYSLVLVAALNG